MNILYGIKSILKKYGFVFSLFFTIAVILIFHFTRFNGLKIYPVAVNFSIFLMFFMSIFQKETVIQKFAKMTEGELTEPVKIYTRNLTYIWCIFLLIQFILSVVTCFMSDTVWMIYNGFLSYVFLGIFFAIEYTIRIIFRLNNKL